MHRPSGTPALHAAQAAGLEYALVEVQHSEHQEGGYALDTARVLERDPSTIFKTLMAKVDGDPVCAVVPASGMLNLKALARAVGGKKACMMQAQDAERLTGYVTGGISPLGQRTSSPIVIDESARSSHRARLRRQAGPVHRRFADGPGRSRQGALRTDRRRRSPHLTNAVWGGLRSPPHIQLDGSCRPARRPASASPSTPARVPPGIEVR